jgi:hypothetical protein
MKAVAQRCRRAALLVQSIAMGTTMTIKTLVAVALAISSVIIVLFTVNKVTTPSRLRARSGTLFIGSSTIDDWGAGTGATGNWEANYAEGSQ